MGLLAEPAVFLVQGVDGVVEGHALCGVPGGHLGEEHGGGDGVLIPDVVAQHVAVALLVGEDDLALAALFQGVLLLGHELEAGEGVVAGDAVGLGHLPGHLGGDDGLEQHGLFRHGAGPAHGADQVVRQQHAGLVAGDGDEGAVVCPDHDAHTVAVGVGAQDEVGAHLVGQLDGQIEALGILRVGGDHGGEVAVQHHLLFHAVEVLHAQLTEGLGHQLVAAAVEGGVDHLEGVGHLGHGGLVVDHFVDFAHEGVVGLGAQDLDASLCHGLVEVHASHAVEDVDALQRLGDGVGVVGGQLGAVGPVDLVAVVLLGVVAGGDVDAGLAAVVADGEAQLRGGAQALKEAHVDAVGGADLGGGPGEVHGVVAAVHADGHAAAFGLLALGADHLGEALGGPADDVHVHLVQAHLHGAPQSGGAELQRPVEPALDLLLVARDGPELLTLGLGDGAACEPLLIFLTVIHASSSSSILFSVSSRGRAARMAAASSCTVSGT